MTNEAREQRYDEREDGCPVCEDVDCLEAELAYHLYRQAEEGRAVRDAEILAHQPKAAK